MATSGGGEASGARGLEDREALDALEQVRVLEKVEVR